MQLIYYNDILSEYEEVDAPCLVHMDFRPGNILVDNGLNIVGLIDFESAHGGSSEIDLTKVKQYVWDVYPNTKNEMRETRFKEGFECPHCSSEYVVRFGKYNGRQRYRCKACSKTFTDTTNTVLYRTRKGNEWITFVDCMFNGYSLRKSAEIVGVSWITLFYWRHKLLNALKQMDFEHFEGIVEIDETYSYTLKKDNEALQTANHVNVVGSPSIE